MTGSEHTSDAAPTAPVFTCFKCGRPIVVTGQRQGILQVNRSEGAAYTAHLRRKPPEWGTWHWDCDPDAEEWHWDCDPDAEEGYWYWIDLHRVRTWPDLLSMVHHVSRKRWWLSTDMRRLVDSITKAP